jgi:HK97 family phage portal protein
MGLFSSLLGSTDANPRGGPDNDFWYTPIGKLATMAGIRITPEIALQVSAVFACIKVISETLAALPLIVYERLSDREKQRAYAAPEYQLLARAPNGWQTPYDFKENLTAWAALHGGGYAIKVPGDDGFTTAELDPVHPKLMRVEKLPSRRLRYWIRQPDGTEKPYVQGEILHIRGFAPDGIAGLNLSESAKEAIALARALDAFAARYFANDTTVGVILEHPGKLSPAAHDNLRASFVANYGGVNNAWRPKILEEGLKLNRLEAKAKDAQLTEGRLHQVIEICRFYRMPPHKVQHLLNATFSNIEHQAIEFVGDTMTPWAVRWEEAVTRDIIVDDAKYFAEFLMTALLRGDQAARSAYYTQRFNIGTISRNEIRALENENPIVGGDTYYVQGALVPLDDNGVPQQPKRDGSNTAPQNTATRDPATDARDNAAARLSASRPALRTLIADAADRIARAEQRELEKRTDKAGADFDRFARWADTFYAAHAVYAARTLVPLADAWAQLGAEKLDADSIARAIAADGRRVVASPEFVRDPAAAIVGCCDRVTTLILTAFFHEDHANAA